MKRSHFENAMEISIVINLSAIVIGIVLAQADISIDLVKAGVPFIISASFIYIAYCFQLRNSFLKGVRQLWGNMLHAVHLAISYTHTANPSEKQYCEVLLQLDKLIDEVRGVFMGPSEKKGEVGARSFQKLYDIRQYIAELGHGAIDAGKAANNREKINLLWQDLRKTVISELDRAVPSQI